MCEIMKRLFMSIRNFVLKLVQKESGKRTHVTIEQKVGSEVEPSPKGVYTFEKVDKSANSVDIHSFKRMFSGAERPIGWSVGTVSGEGASLVVVNKREGGVDILIGHNSSENEKSWSVTLTQEESGKEITLAGIILPIPMVDKYEFEASEEFGDLKGFSYLYRVNSLHNLTYQPFKVSVTGSARDLVKTEIFNELNQGYLGLRVDKNTEPLKRDIWITLKQEDSGKELKLYKEISSKPYVPYTFKVEKEERGDGYRVTSEDLLGNFIGYDIDVSGDGKKFVDIERDQRRNYLFYVSIKENKTLSDLNYVITLTQHKSGKKLEIKGVVNSLTGGLMGDDLKTRTE